MLPYWKNWNTLEYVGLHSIGFIVTLVLERYQQYLMAPSLHQGSYALGSFMAQLLGPYLS